MGRQAYSKLRKEGLSPRLVTGQAQRLPFRNNFFQQVVSTFPTQYILAQETLTEIFRLLTPGGSLIVLPVAWITGSAWYDRMLAGLFRVTGQAPEWDVQFIKPFIEATFQVQIKHQYTQSSKILIVLCTKPRNV